MKRRTEITIETERVVVLEGTERPTGGETRRCAKCSAVSRVIGADAAAALLGVSTYTILRLAEAAGLHLVESVNGTVLICLCSHALREERAEAVELQLDDGILHA
jgi:hypothetical protein